MVGLTDKWMDMQTNGWTDRRMKRHLDKWLERKTNGETDVQIDE
jgi:hypothetical protein